MRNSMSLLGALVCVVVSACGSKASAPVVPAVKLGFHDMDHEQRETFMKETVTPQMAALFREHNAEEFKEFNCKTCHGPGAEKGNFEMPNAELPVLDFNDMSKWKQPDLDFMKRITPMMAKMLGETDWSPENPKGFGCLGCHTQKQ